MEVACCMPCQMSWNSCKPQHLHLHLSLQDVNGAWRFAPELPLRVPHLAAPQPCEIEVLWPLFYR